MGKLVQNVFRKACTIYAKGYYPSLTVKRYWSKNNPVYSGDLAHPKILKNYLLRELDGLTAKGAVISIKKSRPVVSYLDPQIINKIDDLNFNLLNKKLFLFSPERTEFSVNRLEHYCGVKAEVFKNYIILTNYQMHLDLFAQYFKGNVIIGRTDAQMPSQHCQLSATDGISIINIGVGPSNAKTITDHLAVLKPDAIIMIGHCGGLRNHQEIGDYVIATGFVRDDLVLDAIIPIEVPIIPHHIVNCTIMRELEEQKLNYRLGSIFITTADRNWELNYDKYLKRFSLSRAVAVDMESATVATNCFKYRIPFATILCVSDKPLHGKLKQNHTAQKFYAQSKQKHLEMAINTIKKLANSYKEGLPSTTIRGYYDPIL